LKKKKKAAFTTKLQKTVELFLKLGAKPKFIKEEHFVETFF